jgi:glycosyltransferase involved in cell wall biosynthesis
MFFNVANKIYNLLISRRQNVSCFPEVRLFPEKGVDRREGTVALSYLSWPFKEGWDIPKAYGHTNAFEAVAIAQAYLKQGFCVEVSSYDNHHYLPPKDTCIAIDLHHQLTRWAPSLPLHCLKILHATGAHWLTSNRAELDRLAAILERQGVALLPRRQVAPSFAAEIADAITILGNEFTQDSFAFAQKPMYRIPISSAFQFPYPQGRKMGIAKKNFLWLGSLGMVHKGLDLVLEAFAQLPELRLTVCGSTEKEDDFYQCYRQELKATTNIQYLGWCDLASPQFQKIAHEHAAIIYPSCSEGGGGSVIHAMHAGLIPICTREASVDLCDFGMLIREGSVEAVKEAALTFASLSEGEVEARARASYDYVNATHTRPAFQYHYQQVINTILGK